MHIQFFTNTDLSAIRCQRWDSHSYHFSVIAWCHTKICGNYSFLNKLEAAQYMGVITYNENFSSGSALGRLIGISLP
jgi:hypothetical protein